MTPPTQIIAVTSTGGVSGKSTTALLVAAHLAATSKVVLVDLDTHNGNVSHLLGRHRPTALSVQETPGWTYKTVNSNLVYDNELHLDVLLSPVTSTADTADTADFYQSVITTLTFTHDVIVLDVPCISSPTLLARLALTAASSVLFVTDTQAQQQDDLAAALTAAFTHPAHGGFGVVPSRVGVVMISDCSHLIASGTAQ